MKNCYTITLLFLSLLSCYQKPTDNFKQDKVFAAVTTYKIPDEVAVIYRSIDAGNTWYAFSNGIPAQATISSFVSRGSKIFAATIYHGVFVSEERLNNWAACKYGLYFSADHGNNWSRIKTGLPDSTAFTTLEVLDAVLFAGIGLRKSRHNILR